MDIVEKIIERAETLDNSRLLIAVDGRCAAGKTTLAERLRETSGWSVFHMDDFFLRPEQRTEERLNTPGENVDHERFLEEVLLPLRNGSEEISFRPFDCGTLSLKEPIRIKAERVCVVEGSYSCHPALWDNYDLRIFLTVDPEEQMRRIVRRNGAENAVRFAEKWIPLEEKYFSAYKIQSRCDMRF
ncbi:MAG: uridine kinase [Oscillospiraceae bacterium]|nr:uridine kinase [Oscillospiraceae bacterium]